MKGVVHYDNLKAFFTIFFPGIPSGKFYRCLVCLRATVAKEDLVSKRMINKDFCCLDLGLHIKEVRYMEELSCLGNQTVEDFFAHMPEIADSDTGKKVQVSPAVKVPYPASFALGCSYGISIIRVCNVFLCLLNKCFLHLRPLL